MRRLTGFLAGMLLAASVVAAPEVAVNDAWVRATAPGQDSASAAMVITSRRAARLVGVSSPVAGKAQIPTMKQQNGMMIMREVAIKHGMQSAKDVLRPFSRVLLKVISTGNQLAPNMITRDAFPDWGPNVSKVEAPLDVLRKAVPVPTMHTTETAWEVNLKTSVELYTIWEESGVLQQLETIDENLFDVITDIMEEKREQYQEWLEEQSEAEDE